MAWITEPDVLALRLRLDQVGRPPRSAQRDLLIAQHGFDIGGLELLAVLAVRRVLLQPDDGGVALGQRLRGDILR
jgi:hypothetical protein